MREKICCVYAITSPSGKSYIGSTVDYHKRMREHKSMMVYGNHHCQPLNDAYKKYGDAMFNFSILELCDRSIIVEREQYWIDSHAGGWDGLYNTSPVAGRIFHTPEIRAKMSKSLRGRTYSEDARKRMSEGSKGKVASQKAREAMSKAQLGRRHSDETKRKIGDARKGRKYTPEHRAAMSAGIRGSMKPNAKSGVCGVSWNSNDKRWKATVWAMGKAIHLGSFKELDDAIAARRAGEEKYLDTTPKSVPTTTPTQTEEAK